MNRKTILAGIALGFCASAFALPVTRGPKGRSGPVRPIHLGPKIFVADIGDNAFMLPAAGSLPGQDGTFFRSDVTLVNYNSAPQIVAIYWLQEGVDSTSIAPVNLTLQPNSIQTFDDFVGTTLGHTGLGSILVFCVDSNGDFDSTGGIDGEERIWTNDPACAGTSSLSFPPVSVIDSSDTIPAFAFGVRQDSNFRANVGLVNLDTVAHTWTVTILGGARNGTTFTVQVPADSMNQVALPPGVDGEIGLGFVPDNSDNFYWSAYASSEDNASGDGWVSHAKQP